MSVNLLYHDVTVAGADDSSGFPGPGAAQYKLTIPEFEQHLAWIQSAVRQPGIISCQKSEWLTNDAIQWSLTFDDGGQSAITEIAPRLERRGWRGWFFVTTDRIGSDAFCTADQIRELHQRGHQIGSHSCSHPAQFSSCSWEQMVDEWQRSCKLLSEIVGQPILSASVPGGFYSQQVAKAASKAGIRVLFNSEPTVSSFEVDGELVLGRYNIYRGMHCQEAVSLLRSPFRRWRQAVFWNLKKAGKTLAGPLYRSLRQQILTRRHAPESKSQNPQG